MLPESFPIEGYELRRWLNTDGQRLLLKFDTGAEALRTIRDAGMEIRTGDFYKIYNAVWERAAQAEALAGLPGNMLIPLEKTITNTDWNLSTTFLYKFHIVGYDSITGEIKELDLSIGSNYQLSPTEAADMLDQMIVGGISDQSIIDPVYNLVGAYGQPQVGQW